MKYTSQHGNAKYAPLKNNGIPMKHCKVCVEGG